MVPCSASELAELQNSALVASVEKERQRLADIHQVLFETSGGCLLPAIPALVWQNLLFCSFASNSAVIQSLFSDAIYYVPFVKRHSSTCYEPMHALYTLPTFGSMLVAMAHIGM